MTPTYTLAQVIESYKSRCRLFNAIEKRINPSLVLVDGLKESDWIVVGDLELSIPSSKGGRVGRTYERPAVNA